MCNVLCILFVIFIIFNASGNKLPDYIHRCRISEENFNECALQSTRKALPIIVKGDKKFKLPSLDPLLVEEISMSSGENLRVKMSQCQLLGISRADVRKLRFDFNENIIYGQFLIDHFTLLAKYVISGSILFIPVEGQGPVNITMDNSLFNYYLHFTFVEKNGKEFIKPTTSKIEFNTERGYFELGNLFGGDEVIGHQVNAFLYENWKEVLDSLKPDVSAVIANIITSIATSYFDRVPVNDLFL